MSEADLLAGKQPFFWKADSAEAVLCLHGFTGAPGVFRKLGRGLLATGLSVYAPLLPGHGTTPEDLAHVSSLQLLDAAERAYGDLARVCKRVHLVGLSMGGTLSTLLAERHAGEQELGSVSLLSPGYGFNRVLAQKLGLDHWANLTEHEGKMIPLPTRRAQNDDMDECLFGYAAAPLNLFGELLVLNKAAREAQRNIAAPVQLLYAAADAVVDAEASAEAAKVFRTLEDCFAYPQSEHNLLLGGDREDVMQRCTAFVCRHRLPTAEGGRKNTTS